MLHTPNENSVTDSRFAPERLNMVEEIRAMALDPYISQPRPLSEKVLAVMAEIPRHRFVPEEEKFNAYGNFPLPIGHGQTISQPYIVALMTDLLALERSHCVLEVGTGSGYQTAILSRLAGKVFSMEIVAPLAVAAAQLLHELGCSNVEVHAGDGSKGWPEHAPYDGIIVTAAAAQIPQPLLDQLKPGGRMVIPVGGRYDVQNLLLISKDSAGVLQRRSIESVRFVPLIAGGMKNGFG